MNTRIFSPLKVAAYMLVTVTVMAVSCDNDKDDDDDEDDAVTVNDDTLADTEEMNIQKEEFITEAAGISIEEIRMGELAMSKGTSPDVKSLGEMMRNDHQDMLDDLLNLSKDRNISVPTDLTPDAQQKVDELNNTAKGIAFDRKFAQMMVDGHKKAIDRFEKASAVITDPDLDALIRTTLPKLRTHLEHSQECWNKVNGDNIAAR